MRLPNRQLIAAGLIVVLAPIGTIIAAQSFDNFLSTPQPVRVETPISPVNQQPLPPKPEGMTGDGGLREGAPLPQPPQPPQTTAVALPENLKAKCGTLEECKSYCGEHKDECRDLIRSERTEQRAPEQRDEERRGPDTRTCNINGREVPGQCPTSDGDASSTRSFSGGGGDQQGDQRMGPSDEEMEQREREQKQRMLQEMKRNIKNMERGITASTTGLKVCVAAKVEIPSELTQQIAEAKALIQKVKQATSADEIEDIDFSIMPEIGDSVREIVDTCHRLREIPRITKQITSEVKRVERELKSLKTRADRAGLDLAEQFSAAMTGIASVKETLAIAAQAKTADDVAAAMEKIEDIQDVFEGVHETLGTIRGVVDMQRGLRDAKNEIRNAERQIAALKRKKVNVTELTGIVAEAKTLVVKITAITKQKPLDIEAVISAFEELEDIGGRADDAFARAEGREPGEDLFGKSPSEKLKLDAFEQYRKKETSGGDLESLLGL